MSYGNENRDLNEYSQKHKYLSQDTLPSRLMNTSTCSASRASSATSSHLPSVSSRSLADGNYLWRLVTGLSTAESSNPQVRALTDVAAVGSSAASSSHEVQASVLAPSYGDEYEEDDAALQAAMPAPLPKRRSTCKKHLVLNLCLVVYAALVPFSPPDRPS